MESKRIQITRIQQLKRIRNPCRPISYHKGYREHRKLWFLLCVLCSQHYNHRYQRRLQLHRSESGTLYSERDATARMDSDLLKPQIRDNQVIHLWNKLELSISELSDYLLVPLFCFFFCVVMLDKTSF